MIVLDASVLVKLVTMEPGSHEAVERIYRAEKRLAPDWAIIEVGNALSRKVREGMLPLVQARRALDAVPTFLTHLAGTSSLIDVAFQLSVDLKHPLYDCFYLALAMREQGHLLTCDARFGEACARYHDEMPVEVLRF